MFVFESQGETVSFPYAGFLSLVLSLFGTVVGNYSNHYSTRILAVEWKL